MNEVMQTKIILYPLDNQENFEFHGRTTRIVLLKTKPERSRTPICKFGAEFWEHSMKETSQISCSGNVYDLTKKLNKNQADNRHNLTNVGWNDNKIETEYKVSLNFFSFFFYLVNQINHINEFYLCESLLQ